jgi:tetratricopeptide (TPR) repeat protein
LSRHSQDLRKQMEMLLTEGRFTEAAEFLHSLYGPGPPRNLERTLDLRCALAGAGEISTLAEVDEGIDAASLSSGARAKLMTSRAFVRYVQGHRAEAKGDLIAAIKDSPDFALAHNVLARHYLFFEKDYAQARTHLNVVRKLVPSAIGPAVDLINIDLDERDLVAAHSRAKALVREHPSSVRALVALGVTSIVMAPLQGKTVPLALIAAMFLPYVGPLLLAGWIAFSAVTLISLRRARGAIAGAPTALLLVALAAYAARSIVYARLFP